MSVAVFRLVIDEVEKTLAQVDLTMAAKFASLVEDNDVRERIFSLVEKEYRLTRDMVLMVSGSADIADRFPHFNSRIERRANVINQVSKAQVELIKQFRRSAASTDQPDSEPLLHSINCIAAGLGWTG